MAATPSSTTSTMYQAGGGCETHGIGKGRPLSTIQLLNHDKDGEEDGEEEEDEEKHSTRNRNNENLVNRFSLHHIDNGIENGAFEMGSPLTPLPAPTVDNSETNNMNRQSKISFCEFRLSNGNKITFEDNRNADRKNHSAHTQNDNNSINEETYDNVVMETINEISHQVSNGNVQQSQNLQHTSDVSMVTETTEERNGGSESSKNCNKTGEGKSEDKTSIEITPGGRQLTRFGRSSWLLDGNVKRRDDTVWRRRKTDPSGEFCASNNYSYHRDYQEALSSLLWEPYECRQPEASPQQSTFGGGNMIDDADVSVWLYPRILRTTKDTNEDVQYGYRANVTNSQSSSSSTSSMTSSSSSAALGAVAMAGEGHMWKRTEKDPSSSSLRALILSNSSSKEDGWGKTDDLATTHRFGNNGFNRVEARRPDGADSTSSCNSNKIGNVTSDPNQVQEEEDDVSRRPTPVVKVDERGEQEAAAEDAVTDLHKQWDGTSPPGALVSAEERCELCWLQCSQCEDSRVEDCSYCSDTPARMLVNIDTGGGDSANSVSASVSATTTSSVSVVSCYRAVPVVVSAVPTISCLNSDLGGSSNNVSNVHIVPEGGARGSGGRTFTSTEAQTDDIGVVSEVAAPSPSRTSNNNREHRRRERRERRHQRRLNLNNLNGPPPLHPHEPMWQTQVVEQPPASGGAERLPDILNSHLPPPYSTLPIGLPPPGHIVHPHLHPPPPPPVPPPVPVPVPPPVAVPAAPGSPPHHHHGGMRFPFQITPTGRRRSRRSPRGQHYTPEEEPKSCCGVVVTQTVSIRWFIVMIAFVGICCAVVGTVLGAMKASGREHLTVSLLMIGVGIVLITVSGVAWRLTAHDAPSCRMMLGLGGGDEGGAEPNRRFVPRLPPSYGRPHHPYAAMMYPEFQYRPPPPSYQASMQEYRLRLLLLDRHPGTVAPGQAPGGHTVSPPPTYRSHAGSTLRAPLGVRRDQPQSDYSRPPSYRSRTSSTRPTLDPNGNTGCSTAEHSRDPSLSLSESGGGSTVVNVISVMGSGVPEPEPLDTIKLAGLPADQDVPLRMMLNKSGCRSSGHMSGMDSDGKDGNLVTIVQTGNDSSPVIVTVSGSTMATTTMGGSTSQQPGSGIVDTEMEILAHL